MRVRRGRPAASPPSRGRARVCPRGSIAPEGLLDALGDEREARLGLERIVRAAQRVVEPGDLAPKWRVDDPRPVDRRPRQRFTQHARLEVDDPLPVAARRRGAAVVDDARREDGDHRRLGGALVPVEVVPDGALRRRGRASRHRGHGAGRRASRRTRSVPRGHPRPRASTQPRTRIQREPPSQDRTRPPPRGRLRSGDGHAPRPDRVLDRQLGHSWSQQRPASRVRFDVRVPAHGAAHPGNGGRDRGHGPRGRGGPWARDRVSARGRRRDAGRGIRVSPLPRGVDRPVRSVPRSPGRSPTRRRAGGCLPADQPQGLGVRARRDVDVPADGAAHRPRDRRSWRSR